MLYGVTPSSLGLPGDAAGGDDFVRPPRPGAAAGVRSAAAVLEGGRPLPRERDGRAVTGSDLGMPGDSLVSPTEGR